MRGTREIIEEVTALPVEERARMIDSLLRTLNPPQPEIDIAWAEVARRRLAELRPGRVKAIPGDLVFRRIKERFAP